MRIEYGVTDLVLTSHAGLPALAQLLKAARPVGSSPGRYIIAIPIPAPFEGKVGQP
jgi:hypothetical protein